jgi:hypothetical protein
VEEMVDLEQRTVHSGTHSASAYQSFEFELFSTCDLSTCAYFLNCMLIRFFTFNVYVQVMARIVKKKKSCRCFQLAQCTQGDLDTCLSVSSLEDRTN